MDEVYCQIIQWLWLSGLATIELSEGVPLRLPERNMFNLQNISQFEKLSRKASPEHSTNWQIMWRWPPQPMSSLVSILDITSNCCSAIYSGPLPLWWWQFFQWDKACLKDKGLAWMKEWCCYSLFIFNSPIKCWVNTSVLVHSLGHFAFLGRLSLEIYPDTIFFVKVNME